MWAIIENLISPDYVLCYIPRVFEILGIEMKILEYISNYLISVAAPL